MLSVVSFIFSTIILNVIPLLFYFVLFAVTITVIRYVIKAVISGSDVLVSISEGSWNNLGEVYKNSMDRNNKRDIDNKKDNYAIKSFIILAILFYFLSLFGIFWIQVGIVLYIIYYLMKYLGKKDKSDSIKTMLDKCVYTLKKIFNSFQYSLEYFKSLRNNDDDIIQPDEVFDNFDREYYENYNSDLYKNYDKSDIYDGNDYYDYNDYKNNNQKGFDNNIDTNTAYEELLQSLLTIDNTSNDIIFDKPYIEIKNVVDIEKLDNKSDIVANNLAIPDDMLNVFDTSDTEDNIKLSVAYFDDDIKINDVLFIGKYTNIRYHYDKEKKGLYPKEKYNEYYNYLKDTNNSYLLLDFNNIVFDKNINSYDINELNTLFLDNLNSIDIFQFDKLEINDIIFLGEYKNIDVNVKIFSDRTNIYIEDFTMKNLLKNSVNIKEVIEYIINRINNISFCKENSIFVDKNLYFKCRNNVYQLSNGDIETIQEELNSNIDNNENIVFDLIKDDSTQNIHNTNIKPYIEFNINSISFKFLYNKSGMSVTIDLSLYDKLIDKYDLLYIQTALDKFLINKYDIGIKNDIIIGSGVIKNIFGCKLVTTDGEPIKVDLDGIDLYTTNDIIYYDNIIVFNKLLLQNPVEEMLLGIGKLSKLEYVVSGDRTCAYLDGTFEEELYSGNIDEIYDYICNDIEDFNIFELNTGEFVNYVPYITDDNRIYILFCILQGNVRYSIQLIDELIS